MLCRVDEKRVDFWQNSAGLDSLAAALIHLEAMVDLCGCNSEYVRGLVGGLSSMGIRVEEIDLRVTHLKKVQQPLLGQAITGASSGRAVGKVRHYDQNLGRGVIDTECGKKVSVGWRAVSAMGECALVPDDIVEFRIVDGPELQAAEICLVVTQD